MQCLEKIQIVYIPWLEYFGQKVEIPWVYNPKISHYERYLYFVQHAKKFDVPYYLGIDDFLKEYHAAVKQIVGEII